MLSRDSSLRADPGKADPDNSSNNLTSTIKVEGMRKTDALSSDEMPCPVIKS